MAVAAVAGELEEKGREDIQPQTTGTGRGQEEETLTTPETPDLHRDPLSFPDCSVPTWPTASEHSV